MAAGIVESVHMCVATNHTGFGGHNNLGILSEPRHNEVKLQTKIHKEQLDVYIKEWGALAGQDRDHSGGRVVPLLVGMKAASPSDCTLD
eukprot:1159888-Pelagomonas_calceolata.AAC.7